MSLAELQSLLADALVEPDSIARSPAWALAAAGAVGGSARMKPVEQLDVYREQFWLRHVACVAEDYPALVALMGQQPFEALVAEYLGAHPPADFLLRNLGAGLAEFLVARRPDDPLLADLARVEWAFIDAFDAADAPPLDPNAVAAIPADAWPAARLVLHPSLQRLRLAHPAHEVRAAFCRAPREPLARVSPAATHLVVYRDARELRPHQWTLDALASCLLDRLAAGEPLGQAADALATESGRGEEVQAQIGAWFTQWAALGWISRVEVEQSACR
ncbi:MAG TPA: DNA-binding domain-containing protein [Polyangiaceae bacterium]|nr:DNA-binding domain-containing protein [Polyangiaceae bacterium]